MELSKIIIFLIIVNLTRFDIEEFQKPKPAEKPISKESKSVKPDVSRNNKKPIPSSNTAAKGSKLNETLPAKRNTSVSVSATMKRPKSQAPEKEEKLEKIKEKPDNKIPKPIPAITKSATSKPLNTIKKIVTKPELKDTKEKDAKDIKDNKSKDLKESKDRVKPLKGGSSKNAPIVSKPKTPVASSSNMKKEEKLIEKEKVTARFETDTNEFKTEQELPLNNANVDVDEVIVTNANNEVELNMEGQKEESKKEIDNIENDDVIKTQQNQEVPAEEKVLIVEIESNEHIQHQDIDQVSNNENLSSEQVVNENINLPLVDKKSIELNKEEPTIEHNNISQTNEPNEENLQKVETIEDKQEVLINDEKEIESNLEIIHNSADPINKDQVKEEIHVAKEEELSQENNNKQEEIAKENEIENDNSANINQEQEQQKESNINNHMNVLKNDETEDKKEQELEKSSIESANCQLKDQEEVIIVSAVIEPQQENNQIQEANLDSKDENQSLSNNL